MKLKDLLDRLGKLDPGTDLNDLRACTTTNVDDIEALRQLVDDHADSWEEYGARLVSKVVLPLLLEQRDLLLMPASERGWAKPAEMARKVAEQVDTAEAKCAERIGLIESDCAERVAAAQADCERMVAAAQAEFSEKLSAMADEHMARATRQEDAHRKEMNEAAARHRSDVEERDKMLRDAEERRESDLHHAENRRLREAEEAEELAAEQDRRLSEVAESVPGKQAVAVADALAMAADRSEALARMRLARISKRRGLFRNRDLDDAMLRVEADGLQLAAVKLRTMSEEAKEGQWPVEFAPGEEVGAPDVVVESDMAVPDEAEVEVEERMAEEA